MTPSFPDSGPLVTMTARPTCTKVLKAILVYELLVALEGGDVAISGAVTYR